jgi:hypothetical protein
MPGLSLNSPERSASRACEHQGRWLLDNLTISFLNSAVLTAFQNPSRLHKFLFPPFFDALAGLLPDSLARLTRLARGTRETPNSIEVVFNDRPRRVDARGGGAWNRPVPAPGTSNVVMAPSGLRTRP